MELESSLPCLQEPVTGPCPEPDESSSHPHILHDCIVIELIILQ